MPNEAMFPSTKAYRRAAGSGFRNCECPDCGAEFKVRRGGTPPRIPRDGAPAMLRALVAPEIKQAVLDISREEKVTMSEIVRRAVRLWLSLRP